MGAAIARRAQSDGTMLTHFELKACHLVEPDGEKPRAVQSREISQALDRDVCCQIVRGVLCHGIADGRVDHFHIWVLLLTRRMRWERSQKLRKGAWRAAVSSGGIQVARCLTGCEEGPLRCNLFIRVFVWVQQLTCAWNTRPRVFGIPVRGASRMKGFSTPRCNPTSLGEHLGQRFPKRTWLARAVDAI